jgi:hypothetical protein
MRHRRRSGLPDRQRDTTVSKVAAQPASPIARLAFRPRVHQAFGSAFELKPRVLMNLAAGNRGDALHEVKNALRFAIFLTQNGFNFDVSDLENPFLRRKLSRSSSVRATMRP